MKKFALAGNPNSGKTTLFNNLTGSTAHVGNWPGVTVDKREGTYKKCKEPVQIVDLPGIYSLSPYTPEEVISRNFILDEKPDAVINIVDATNLERNLYLTTQLLEMDVPVIVALNMTDLLNKSDREVDVTELEKTLGVPVVSIAAIRGENVEKLMDVAYEASETPRVGKTVLNDTKISHLINDVTIAFKGLEVDNPLFHAIKLIEKDEIEVKDHKGLLPIIEDFKATFKDDTFGDDLEAVVADERYQFISKNCSRSLKNLGNKKTVENKHGKDKLSISDKVDKVLTNKWAGIPIFILILFVIFHLTFSTNFLFLGGAINDEWVSCAGSQYFEGIFGDGAGIAAPGTVLANFVIMATEALIDVIRNALVAAGSQAWAVSFLCDGILGGLGAVISFLPWILLLFLFFSILEDSGYMARVAFILDRLFRKFGVSGRAFMPMIMGFGCSVPAMINTRTLADEKERTATIRVIPFFSCSAKLPILTAIAGGIVSYFNFPMPDLITLGMYLLGMVVAIIAVLIMRTTTLRGVPAPFIMELPAYHAPSFKGLMIHLWDKMKHFLKKAFTIIFLSTIVIWVLTNFTFGWTFIDEGSGLDLNNSILAGLSQLVQPLATPMGFGSQLSGYGWVFVAAAVAGLIAKEEVVGLFGILAALIVAGEPQEAAAVEVLIQNTGITPAALIAFIMFNMTTIPCFAAVATAKAELPKGKLHWTLGFWLLTSYIVATSVYLMGEWPQYAVAPIIIVLVLVFVGLYYYNKKKSAEEVNL